MDEPMTPQRSVAIAANIFQVFGWLGVVNMLVSLSQGSLLLDFNVLGLLAAPGLRRFDPYWYKWSLRLLVLEIVVEIVTMVWLPFLASDWPLRARLFSFPLRLVPWWFAAAIVVASAGISAWQLILLRRPGVRDLFPEQGMADAEASAAS